MCRFSWPGFSPSLISIWQVISYIFNYHFALEVSNSDLLVVRIQVVEVSLSMLVISVCVSLCKDIDDVDLMLVFASRIRIVIAFCDGIKCMRTFIRIHRECKQGSIRSFFVSS